jgi:6-phosphofructokinase 1
MVEQNRGIGQDIFKVESLHRTFKSSDKESPLKKMISDKYFVSDTNRVLADISSEHLEKSETGVIASFELAGPREKVFFESENLVAAIVTCGGLAPGLNNVVQSVVSCLYERYGVKNIFGVPYGYRGFEHDVNTLDFSFPWMTLDENSVHSIDDEGGSILGSGRCSMNAKTVVDALLKKNVNILFTIGGDGTLAGANLIYEESKKRKQPISIIGIPKTIDNDILWVSKSFGFETALEMAISALKCAQAEARSLYNGVGLVKIMGRNCGLLTATAAASIHDLDFVLIPEVSLKLDGEKGFLKHLRAKIKKKGYCTIALAEGAGQTLFSDEKPDFDESGNKKLKDIGGFLKDRIIEDFHANDLECNLKYIVPSYMLRAQTTLAGDSLFCKMLGENAVHAAMSGKTGCMVGYAHETFTHVPLKAVCMAKKFLNVDDPLWLSALTSTGQPEAWS